MYAAYAHEAMPTSAIPEIIMAVSSIITTAITSHEVPMTPAAAMVPNLTTYYDNSVLLIYHPSLHRHQGQPYHNHYSVVKLISTF